MSDLVLQSNNEHGIKWFHSQKLSIYLKHLMTVEILVYSEGTLKLVLTKTPVSLSSIQCFGAATRFRCFFGPLA